MCLTIPGKIVSIRKGVATVKNGSKKAHVDLGVIFDAKIGDWLLYFSNRAVKLISEEDAQEIISLLKDNYHSVDVSCLSLEFKKIIYKVRSGDYDLKPEEIKFLLSLEGSDNLETLFAEANSLRKERIEDFVCIHGIIEFSNYCKNNCHYCGIRRDNKEIKRYRMTKEEIVATAKKAVEKDGYKLLVLQSGEDNYYTDEMVVEIIKSIKKLVRVFIFISVGKRSHVFYKKALRAGATGSLMRFETSNPVLYSKLHPKDTLEARVSNLEYQKKVGYYVATGSLIGLPGQSISDIANDLLLVKKLNIQMISSGPFIPTKGTPLFNKIDEKKQIELFLKYVAAARFMMPNIKIPVTTALETLDKENGRHRGLLSGANALMFNLTPKKYAGKYSIYDNKYYNSEKVWQKYGLFKGEESYEMLEERLKALL